MTAVVIKVMPEEILERIRCPRCAAPVTRSGDGGVTCPEGHRFAEHAGYLDFSQEAGAGGSTERTFASFGYEWNAFDGVRDEDERFADVYFRDLDLEGMAGKVGLDAGCGKGRFTRILARHLAAEVALDGSAAVEAAARSLHDLDNVTVVRSDLRAAPFAPESFDFISSLGVLHHLDDPFEGFTRLLTYLAPKGQVLLYLYSRPSEAGIRATALTLATALRKVTVRLPHPALKALSTPIAGLLSLAFVLPGRFGQRRGIARLAGLPMDTTFDRLSAPVEYRYVWTDLQPWFDETGLVVDAARDETGWFILAHRP
jgi:SAM-dependent methyltransferase